MITSKHLARLCAALLLLHALMGCDSHSSPVEKEQQTSPTPNQQLVGGGCDGCELMEEGTPEQLDATDTSAGWFENGQRLLLTGIVYRADGKTPAANVIIYYWHTDKAGYYSPAADVPAKVLRHGHLRGWVKTAADGRYTLCTNRPAPYPGEDIPAHIHTAVKEPGIANAYYIDEFVLDDDPLLTTAKRRALENRGGSGILRILLSGELQMAEHDIFLGRNIPNYPDSQHD